LPVQIREKTAGAYLDTEGEGSDIEKENVGDGTSEDTSLDSSSDGDSLIGVDTLRGITTEDRLDGLDNLGHTRHSSDEDNLLNLGSLHSSIGESLLARFDGLRDESADELLELRTGELEVDVLGSGSVGGDVGKVDVGLSGRGKFDLGLFSGFTDTLDSHTVLGEVESRLLLELGDDVVDEGDVEIFSSQMSVTVGRLYFEDSLLHLEDRNIERSSSEIIDGDLSRVVAVETVSESGSGRLVDDTENVETGDGSGILGSLTLRVVEVGGDGDDYTVEAASA
jgi:hypothetical protein